MKSIYLVLLLFETCFYCFNW